LLFDGIGGLCYIRKEIDLLMQTLNIPSEQDD